MTRTEKLLQHTNSFDLSDLADVNYGHGLEMTTYASDGTPSGVKPVDPQDPPRYLLVQQAGEEELYACVESLEQAATELCKMNAHVVDLDSDQVHYPKFAISWETA